MKKEIDIIPASPDKARRRASMRDNTCKRLREAILTGVYKPGDWLREEELSRTLGTSRMPVREALRILENEGFLEPFPNRGSRVTEVLTDDLPDLYDARIAVECIMARRAAENVTPETLDRMARNLEAYAEAQGPALIGLAQEFSSLVMEASGSPALRRIGQTIHDLIIRLRYLTHSDPSRKPHTLKEHSAIYRALLKRDPDLVESATLAHFSAAKARSLEEALRNKTKEPLDRLP